MIHLVFDSSIVLRCWYSGIVSIVTAVLLLLWSSNSNYDVLSILRNNVRRVMLPGINKRKMNVLGEKKKQRRAISIALTQKVSKGMGKKKEKIVNSLNFVSGMQSRVSRCKCS